MNITSRLIKVKNELSKNKFDAILVSSIPTITYLTNYANFSKDEREAFLFIVAQPQGLTHKTPGVIGYIITDGRYSEAITIHVPHCILIEIKTGSELKSVLKKIAKEQSIKRLGIEEDNLTIEEHKMLASCFHDLHHFSIANHRAVKEKGEIDTIEKACKLGDEAFAYILKKIKHGITETFLAFELEWFIKRKGADLSFPPIVAFGANSSVPHHHTGDRKLKTADIVLLDFGVKVDNYCSDMTRTVFFGKANDKQRKMYHTVLTAQQKAMEHLRRLTSDGGSPELVEGHDSSEVESIEAKNIDKVARDYITTQGFPTIPHSLGHGIGLEVHEVPRLSPNSKDILREGMVFSVEPGIYIPGFGGIRIEDLVVLEESGPRLLTTSLKDLIEL